MFLLHYLSFTLSCDVVFLYLYLFSHFSSCSINPVTGRVEEKLPNPMEGMTEEQKEYEAMKLVNMFDKLSRYEKTVFMPVLASV